MSSIHTFQRDPDSTLDYGIDWGEWLAGDTITASSWTIPPGLEKGDESQDATTTTVWLSGGTDGQRYLLTNRVTTAAGRTDERTVRVDVNNR